MSMEKIKKVCVVGGGQMGRQIALNAAMNGFSTRITDTFPSVIEALQPWAREYLQGRVNKNKITEEAMKNALNNFRTADTLESAAEGADLVIEAIVEDKATKEALFTQLNGIVSETCILATNSSFMVASMFTHCISHPERIANLHYFNPALVMKLVEVVQGPHCSDETTQTLLEFARANGKTPVLVKEEIEGFLANRIAKAVGTEALYLAERGVATPQDIDTAVENGLNYPMGPFRLMDLTGLDINYYNRLRHYEKTGKEADRPPKQLVDRFLRGDFGKKTGKGWYNYE